MSIQAQEPWRAYLLRTKETADRYEQAKQEQPSTVECRLCDDRESYAEYEHWKLVPNRYPYDRYFSRSDMLITKRHVDERGLNQAERDELTELKSTVLTNQYDLVMENLPRQQSIPHHYHLHLAVLKVPVAVEPDR